MKPKNFPARRLARQIAARDRADGYGGVSASAVLMHGHAEFPGRLPEARQQRSKKRRDGR